MYIRPATKEDSPAILELVKKLAVYERKKLTDVLLTLEKIKTDCFEHRYFHILIAEDEGEKIGYALFFFTYSASLGAPILYLEDLFVEEKVRNKGIGKALLSELAKIAIDKKCCRMEWHAFTWNEKAIQFYKYLGAELKNDLVQIRLVDGDLVKLSHDYA